MQCASRKLQRIFAVYKTKIFLVSSKRNTAFGNCLLFFNRYYNIVVIVVVFFGKSFSPPIRHTWKYDVFTSPKSRDGVQVQSFASEFSTLLSTSRSPTTHIFFLFSRQNQVSNSVFISNTFRSMFHSRLSWMNERGTRFIRSNRNKTLPVTMQCPTGSYYVTELIILLSCYAII